MKDHDKSREQLVYELGEMRRRMSELESALSGMRTDREAAGVETQHGHETNDSDPGSSDQFESTQTIDLSTVFTEEVTSSGSFSFSGVARTWFGRLLQALPLPAFLVDQSYCIIFVNGACRRISTEYEAVKGNTFSSLFENPWVADEAQSLLEKVFSQRLRESIEAVIRIGANKIWGRAYLRSIRLGPSRSVLVMVEDLTLEKEQLLLKQAHEEEILRERDELEQRVQDRTHELIAANEDLKREIVEREAAQRRLIERESRYRLLVENSPVGIVSCNTEGEITEVNPAVLEFLDIPSFEEAKTWNLITSPPMVASGISEAVRQCIESGEAGTAEFRYRADDRKQIFLRVHIVPIRDGEGEITGIQAAVEDVSEHRRADALLLRSERLRALVEMASGVAHNFNTSLQAVAADTQKAMTYLEAGSVSEMRPLLEQILENAHQTAKTVRRLKQFARSRSTVGTSEIQSFDASEAVREGVQKSSQWWGSDAKRRGIDISVEANLDPDCHVEGDYQEIVEMVMIFLRNATEALPAGGSIRVRSTVEEGQVSIQVQDDGPGIPKKNLEKIFEPFWTSKADHAGMGLAIGSGIVRRHRGTMALTSRDGQGTKITVRLPYAPRGASEKAEGTMETARSYRILLISDDETTRTSLEDEFTRLKYVSFVAATGAMGVRSFDENDVDAVICDSFTQELSAGEITQAIQEIADAKRSLRPRIVLLSDAIHTPGGGRILPRSQVDRTVEKPVTAERLIDIVEEEMRKVAGQATFSGRIHGIDILEYLQLLMISGQQVVVEIISRDDIRGLLYVDNGTVLHSECEQLEGEDALYRCLGFNGGSFSSLSWHDPRKVTISKPGELLLLEAARLRDEMNKTIADRRL